MTDGSDSLERNVKTSSVSLERLSAFSAAFQAQAQKVLIKEFLPHIRMGDADSIEDDQEEHTTRSNPGLPCIIHRKQQI